MTENKSPFLTVSRFAAVPGLVHGFGDGRWSEADFLAFAASREMRPVVMRQLHSDTIHRLEAAPDRKLEGDALMTNVPGLLLVIRTADCLPVLLVDEKNRAVAAVHCGWRGTEKRILENAVRAMGEVYGSRPGEMLAALGPCIGAACYEVGPEVCTGFVRAGFPETLFALRGHVPGVDVPGQFPGRETWGHVPEVRVPLLKPKYLLGLRDANVWLLRELGLQEEGTSSIPVRLAPIASRGSCPTAATPTTPAACTTSSALFEKSPLPLSPLASRLVFEKQTSIDGQGIHPAQGCSQRRHRGHDATAWGPPTRPEPLMLWHLGRRGRMGVAPREEWPRCRR